MPPVDIKYSIIIPTFNRSNYICRILESLANLGQELDETEVIIVDDGSYDNTSCEILNYMSRIPNVNYIYQKNRGPAAARNLGASKASGEYLIFVDDDCLFHRGSLFQIKDFYKNSEQYEGAGVQTVLKTRSIFSEFNQRLGDFLMWSSKTSLQQYEYVSSRCFSFSKQAYNQVKGHDEDFVWPGAEDRDLCLRMAKKGMKFFYLTTNPLSNIDRLYLKAFLKQNFYYGLGCGLFIQKHRRSRSQSARNYPQMVFQICRDINPFISISLFGAFLLAQFSFFVGLAAFHLNYHHEKRPPSCFIPRYSYLLETIKNILLFFPLVKFLKIRRGSITTGDELFAAGAIARTVESRWKRLEPLVRNKIPDKNSFEGMKILEIGPGSHLAFPLILLTYGAKQVVTIDRFGEVKLGIKEREIYQRVSEILPDGPKQRYVDLLQKLVLDKAKGSNASLLQYYPDLTIDSNGIMQRLGENQFDLIISCNTLEHVSNLELAFENMGRLLNKGGLMVHRVDSGSHFAFTRYTKNRLSHFMLSDRWFRLMFSNRAAPTRKLRSDYAGLIGKKGFNVLECIPDEYVTEHEYQRSNPHFIERFRRVGRQDISIVGYYLLATKS